MQSVNSYLGFSSLSVESAVSGSSDCSDTFSDEDVQETTQEENELEVWDIDGMKRPELNIQAKKYGIKCPNMSEKKLQLKLAITKERQALRAISSSENNSYDIMANHLKENNRRQEYLGQFIPAAIKIAKKIESLTCTTYCNELGIVKTGPDPLRDYIHSMFPDFVKHLQDLTKTSLSVNKPCSILISGESGSGKSSFINLLLGMELIPTSLYCNTSTFIRIKYGPSFTATLRLEDGQVLLKENKDLLKFVDEVRSYISNNGDGTRICQECLIECESKILEGGLELIDSPGFGENKGFDEALREYHSNACAFIYMLQKTNPIGDEKIGGLASYVHHLANNLDARHRGSVIFIINKWDALDLSPNTRFERKQVYEYFYDNVKSYWPIDRRDQLLTMSTKDSLFMQKNKVVSEDVANVLEAIQKLWIRSSHNESVQTFRTLMRFVESAIKALKMIFESCVARDYNQLQQRELREMKEKIINLNINITKFVTLQEETIKVQLAEAEERIVKYLRTETIRNRLVEDVLKESISTFSMAMKDIDATICATVNLKLNQYLQEYEKEQRNFSKTLEKLIQNFTNEFTGFEKETMSIEKQLMDVIQLPKEMIVKNKNIFLFNGLRDLSTTQKIVFGVFSPILLPVLVVAGLFALPIKGVERLTRAYDEHFDSQTLQRYLAKENSYKSRKALRLLDEYTLNQDELKKYVDNHMKKAKALLKSYTESVKERIEGLRQRVELLERDERNKKTLEDTYEEIDEPLKSLYVILTIFEVNHLEQDVTDLSSLHVVYDTKKDTNEKILLCRSQLLSIYRGRLCRPSSANMNKQQVGLIAYDWFEVENKYPVIQNLKIFLELGQSNVSGSENFVKFLHCVKYSMNHENVHPLLVVESVSCSLHKHIRKHKYTLKQQYRNLRDYDRELYNFLKEVFLGIARGLQFLHSRKLVHMDLKLQTIAVCLSYSGQSEKIKLASVCSPTLIQVDFNKDDYKYVQQFSHYSPECLSPPPNQDTYTDKSEMYSFGICMYEAWTGIKPFEREIVDRDKPIRTVAQFSTRLYEEMRPTLHAFYAAAPKAKRGSTSTHEPQRSPSTFPRYRSHHAESFYHLIELTWSTAEENRWPAENFIEYLKSHDANFPS